jgi:GTPase Era involved in 16S rRNA processing/gas vesicle protein
MKKVDGYAEQIDQNIKFLESIIQKPSISHSVRQNLSDQIERIKKRRYDPNLYLAIIGEFSSGKSTLINALLRDDLLKTSALVSTATATKIIYNEKFSAEALFKTEVPKQLYGNLTVHNKSSKKAKIAWTPSFVIGIPLIFILFSVAPFSGFLGLLLFPVFVFVITEIIHKIKSSNKTDRSKHHLKKFINSEDAFLRGILPREFVHLVTAEEEIARSLEDFKIYHPANFLKSGIVIIDTPGTDSINEEHGKVTQSVVANEADAALIVIPAGKPVSETLVNFLSNSISSYIHRCIFVVTKMDQIRLKEQSQLAKIIERRLKENLKIDHLFLLKSAPQIVINTLTGEEEIEEKNQHWHDEFIQMEIKLYEYLESSREASIEESINRLLTKVFAQFESHLKERQEEFRLKQKEIERKIIPNLSSFTSEQYQECSRMIQVAVSQTKSKVNSLVNSYKENAMTRIQTKIFEAQNKDDLTNTLKKQVSPIFEDSRYRLNTELTNATSELNNSLMQIKKHFDKKFLQQYQNLQLLSIKNNVATNEITKNAIRVDISDMNAVVSKLSETTGDVSNITTGAGAGVGAGAAIGTMIFPGVGTLVGAALGSLLGGVFGSFFGPSLGELQNRSWDELQPKIQDYFDSTEKEIEQFLNVYSQQMGKELNGHIDIYIETYRKIVDAMKQEQKKQQEDLNRLQKDIQTDLLEIDSRILR